MYWRTLLSGIVLSCGTALAGAQPTAPAWAVDPNDPGPDVPPVGRSLFDLVFSAQRGARREHDVPFPFTALSERLESLLRAPGQRDSTLRKVLIPLGRSLQRNAAAPDFFRYPRVVVAVDSEPHPSVPRPFYLKDRLFIGYQERAGVLEVISYNEQAARFEFQIVDGYAPGKTPRVRYANRAVCTSCHQNGGPIFSRAAWEETNSTTRIANRLAQVQSSFYGVPARRSSVDAAAIDNATDRANLVPAYQLLWRRGCGAGERALRCRATALTAMLQYRLSSFSHFDVRSADYREGYLRVLRENWQALWPAGLQIPDPDIPNRAPPFLTRAADVPFEFDPLNARPPRALWAADGGFDNRRLITGLAEHLPTIDLRRLDQGLYERALADGSPRRLFEGPCAFTVHGALRSGTLLTLECEVRRRGGDGTLTLIADVTVEPDRFVSGAVDSLDMSDGTRFGELRLLGGPIHYAGERRSVSLGLVQRRDMVRARLADGNAIESLDIAWGAAPGALLPEAEQFAGEARLSVLEDFAPIHSAVATLRRAGDAGVLGPRPFEGTSIMRATLAALGLAVTEWCCRPLPELPPVEVESEAGTTPELEPRLAEDAVTRTFYRHCGGCHRTDKPLPPGFLRGERERVAAGLRACAPRIYYRLSMWGLPENERAKSPMPPPSSLAGGLSATRWIDSRELAELSAYAAARLDGATPEALLAQPYDELPVCLPDRGD